MTQFKAYDAKQKAILGDKPLSLTWGKKRGAVSWNAIQMWNASVVLFEEDQCEHDIKTINNMIYQSDFNIKRSSREKWVKRIINAHIQGSGGFTTLLGRDKNAPYRESEAGSTSNKLTRYRFIRTI